MASNQTSVIIPRNTYYVPTQKGHELSSSDDKIIRKSLTTGPKIFAHKLGCAATVYTKKGFEGSRNSNFYEFLSMGTIPYIIGSATFIALFSALNHTFSTGAKYHASKKSTMFAGGVLMYAAGKWLGGKMMNGLTKASTGIDLDLPYKKVVTELPEGPGIPEKTRNEYHKVFESADFFRNDLLIKKGDEEGDRYAYFDKITAKMGFQEKLNAPDQVINPAIKETITKATAAKSLSSYLWAALGVTLAAQAPFANIAKFDIKGGAKKTVVNLAKQVGNTFKDSFKALWKGTGSTYPKVAGALGKALILATFGSTLFGWMNVSSGFHNARIQGKSDIDFKKDYEGM